MKYFAVFLKVKDKKVAEAYFDSHIKYVKQLCKDGTIHTIGGLVGEGGLIIFQAETKEDVEDILAKDPFIKYGARSYELYEWKMQTAEEYIS